MRQLYELILLHALYDGVDEPSFVHIDEALLQIGVTVLHERQVTEIHTTENKPVRALPEGWEKRPYRKGIIGGELTFKASLYFLNEPSGFMRSSS